MITTVTLNPAIDRRIVVENFNVGRLNRIMEVKETIGGKGINVSKVLQSLEADSRSIGLMGEENYEQVLDLLAKEQFKSKWIRVDGKTRTNTKIIDLHAKRTTDLNEAGFQVEQADLEELQEQLLRFAKNSEYVVFSGSLPKGAPKDLYFDLINLVREESRIVLDAEGMALQKGLAAKPHILAPNLFELESILGGEPLESQEAIIQAARNIITEYEVEKILLSMGEHGCLLISANWQMFAPALQIDVKGSVGAGDALLAGFLYGRTLGQSEEESLKWGVACAALTVSGDRLGMFSRKEADALRQQVEVRV